MLHQSFNRLLTIFRGPCIPRNEINESRDTVCERHQLRNLLFLGRLQLLFKAGCVLYHFQYKKGHVLISVLNSSLTLLTAAADCSVHKQYSILHQTSRRHFIFTLFPHPHIHLHCCCSHINSHDQVRGHRTGLHYTSSKPPSSRENGDFVATAQTAVIACVKRGHGKPATKAREKKTTYYAATTEAAASKCVNTRQGNPAS